MKNGKFLTLEGIDGAGKSSHLAAIADWARERRIELVTTREPGGTALGETLRDLLLNRSMTPETELLLMFAARQEHLHRVIRPALERGAWVLSDRFTDASYAYQCGGRGIAVERVAALEDWVQQGFTPDLTLLFDVPTKVAVQRREAVRAADRFESEDFVFFAHVREVYLNRAAAEPQRIKVIDGNRDLDAIRVDVLAQLDALAA